MFMNMSPEFGRLKEPEEPGKERVKWLNNRELHTTLTDLEVGKEDRHRRERSAQHEAFPG